MSPPPDARLLARMLDEHGPALALYASQWTVDADDCVQEALVQLARQPAAPDSPAAWLYRVVKHKAMNSARASRRRRDREGESLRRRLVDNQERLASVDALALVELLEHLDDERREIVILRLWSGLTFSEIGAAAGVSTATAQRRYERAMEQLRDAWRSEPKDAVKTS